MHPERPHSSSSDLDELSAISPIQHVQAAMSYTDRGADKGSGCNCAAAHGRHLPLATVLTLVELQSSSSCIQLAFTHPTDFLFRFRSTGCVCRAADASQLHANHLLSAHMLSLKCLSEWHCLMYAAGHDKREGEKTALALVDQLLSGIYH